MEEMGELGLDTEAAGTSILMTGKCSPDTQVTASALLVLVCLNIPVMHR